MLTLGYSRPNGRRLDQHSARARHQIKLKLDKLRRAVIIGLRPDAEDATAQAPLQRAERLPFQAVQRIPGRMPLCNRRPRQSLTPIVVVAIRAGEIELALSSPIEVVTSRNEWRELRIVAGGEGDTARLLRDERSERQEVTAFVS